MPTPQPVPMEAAVSLASLARMTVLQYSRFVKSEQPQSVFTFDSGQLGQVRLAFSESEVGTMLHIVVESTEVRQMLQRALSNLEQEWTHQGLDFSDVNVEVGDTGQEHGFPDQGTAGRNPAISSATIEDSVADMETESVKDYGYNTVEYVA
ncbi:MAG: flagellar hook-length control protein FliK [Fidelibacterota bacterium]|nr:MAG: flagellar hook-length control protein FliK [Candidatus Neomarinimicrobiota bacterium]